MNQRPFFFVAVTFLLLAACTKSTTTAESSAPEITGPEPCGANQFVGCKTGEACARRHGKLIHPHSCHDKAADACAEAACTFGCDVYNDGPKEVHCGVNAASTGNMKKCAGYANWGCPENMTCELTPEAKNADDAMGTCVAAKP